MALGHFLAIFRHFYLKKAYYLTDKFAYRGQAARTRFWYYIDILIPTGNGAKLQLKSPQNTECKTTIFKVLIFLCPLPPQAGHRGERAKSVRFFDEKNTPKTSVLSVNLQFFTQCEILEISSGGSQKHTISRNSPPQNTLSPREHSILVRGF